MAGSYLQITADYFNAKPKYFFGVASTIAYGFSFSPRAKEAALKTAEFFDRAYEAFLWPELLFAVKGCVEDWQWKTLAEVTGFAAAGLEFLHNYLKIIDLGKRLPYVSMAANMGDLAFYGIDLYQRCTDDKAKFSEKLLRIVKDIVCLMLVLSAILTATYGSYFAIALAVNLLLDAAYYIADYSLFFMDWGKK